MTTVRQARAADFYAFARDELAGARICVMMLQAIAESEGGPFVEEATRDGLDHLLDHFVRAERWRELARAARRQGL